MKILILLCLSTSVLGCGLRLSEPSEDAASRPKRHIIGGTNVTVPGRWPWQVYLIVMRQFMRHYTCGATVIAERWVLTAAHCIAFNNEQGPVFGTTLIAGINNSRENKAVVPKVVKRIEYPGFNAMIANDIALLELETPLIYSDSVSPICLPNPSQSIPNDGQAVTIGFGSIGVDENGKDLPSDGQLREVIVPIVPSDVCEERIFHTLNRTTWEEFHDAWMKKNVICASSLAHGTHRGDSGGPLMMKASDGRWFQIGVTSTSSATDTDGYRIPNTFADVRKFCDWIKETTGGEASCQEKEVALEDVKINP